MLAGYSRPVTSLYKETHAKNPLQKPTNSGTELSAIRLISFPYINFFPCADGCGEWFDSEDEDFEPWSDSDLEYISFLPDDVLNVITQFLDFSDLCQCLRISKRFEKACDEGIQRLPTICAVGLKSAAVMRKARTCRKIKQIHLSHPPTSIFSDLEAILASNPSLQTLVTEGIMFRQRTTIFPRLFKCSDLRTLKLHCDEFAASEILYLSKHCTQLTTLFLQSSLETHQCNSAIETLLKTSTALRSLALGAFVNVGFQFVVLSAERKLLPLTELRLLHCNVTNGHCLGISRTLPHLTTLSLAWNWEVQDEGVLEILKRCPKLAKLMLQRTSISLNLVSVCLDRVEDSWRSYGGIRRRGRHKERTGCISLLGVPSSIYLQSQMMLQNVDIKVLQ